MIKKTTIVSGILLFLIFFVCGIRQTEASEATFYPYRFSLNHYTQKANNFLLLLDASGSMTETYNGEKKFRIAKKISGRLNQTIPDLKLTAVLEVLGSGFSNNAKCLYGPTDYVQNDFQKAVNAVVPGGMTPIGDGIDVAVKQLESTSGDIAVIIVSDGKETNNDAFDCCRAYEKKIRIENLYLHYIGRQ